MPLSKEEWYTWDHSPRANGHVLANVDEATYSDASAARMGDHPVIWTNERIAARNVYIFMGLGRSSGLWNTVLRTDCTAISKKPLKWEAKNLNAFDAIVFFTDGDLDMDASQKADLLSFVRDDGKGFIGIHSAAITFITWPEYGEMLGGYFDGHPWGQFNAPLVVEDSTFPGMGNFPATFTLFDEIYQIKDFSRANARVLLSLDAKQIDLAGKGVKRADFPVIWAKNYGKGRVLYNGLGHVQAVWERSDFQKMWSEK